MSGKEIGYKRVSTVDQNPERQLQGIQVDKLFIDYASARTTDRPQLKAMIEFAREDDVIIVHSMDRLARNLTDLRNLVSKFVANGVEVRFIKENIIFNSKDNAISNLLLSVMGAFAEFEHAFIMERQAEGIKIAKALGKFKGAKKKLNAEKIELLKEEMKTRKTKAQIAFNLGISRETLYRYLKNLGIEYPKIEEEEEWMKS